LGEYLERVLKGIEDYGPVAPTELAKRLGINRRTVTNQIRTLKRRDVISKITRKDGSQGYVTQKFYRTTLERFETRLERHSDDIKAFLKSWKAMLPTYNDAYYFTYYGSEAKEESVSHIANVESNLLFQDLKNHDPQLVKQWLSMKEKVLGYDQNRDALVRLTEEILRSNGYTIKPNMVFLVPIIAFEGRYGNPNITFGNEVSYVSLGSMKYTVDKLGEEELSGLLTVLEESGDTLSQAFILFESVLGMRDTIMRRIERSLLMHPIRGECVYTGTTLEESN
jgi:DNA-binding Lrp family transcriptional regulator